MVARPDYVVDVEIADVSARFQTLPRAGWHRVGGNLAFRGRDRAGWFLAGSSQSVSHRGACVPFDLGGMANFAAIRARRFSSHGRRLGLYVRVIGAACLR